MEESPEEEVSPSLGDEGNRYEESGSAVTVETQLEPSEDTGELAGDLHGGNLEEGEGEGEEEGGEEGDESNLYGGMLT